MVQKINKLKIRFGEFSFPESLNLVADLIAREKVKNFDASKFNGEAVKFKKGNPRLNFKVNNQGALGELCFQFFLWKNDIPFKCPPMIGSNSFLPYDMEMGNGYKLDIKTISDGKENFLVNERKFISNKAVTHYVFIQIKGFDHARFDIFDSKEVASWPIKDFGKGRAYFKPIEKHY